MRHLLLFMAFIATHPLLYAQQVPDLSYDPELANPAYQAGEGSVIFIDEGHHNFHTLEGRYKPFSMLLEKDGYVVKKSTGRFKRSDLDACKILVIANALNAVNVDNWTLPTPSAFSEEEMAVIQDWVLAGGRLFLIADHMPWPGAAAELAALFGFQFLNGFNIDVVNPSYFWRSNGTIVESVITSGRDSSEMIHQIPNTEGQAFSCPEDAQPILVFNSTSMILLPDTAWNFPSHTPMKNIDGLAQGAFKKYGAGRIVVFGEASMFSAQIGDPGRRKMGMNKADAKDNHKLLLNIIHWLDGKLD